MEQILADYDEDSVVILNGAVHRGLAQIENLFEGFFEEFAQQGSSMAVDEQVVEQDTAYLGWHGETPSNTYEFCTDTFMIKDGKIRTQTFAGGIEPSESAPDAL